MELKFKQKQDEYAAHQSSNRTFMELKFYGLAWDSSTFYKF